MTETLADQTADVRPFAARMNGTRAEILLDGQDIAHHLAGFRIDAVAGDYPQVVLQLSPKSTAATEFEGLARVVVEDVMSDPGPAAAAFLAAIDAEELEKAALNRIDLESGPAGLTKTMLRQLQEWAHGRS